MKAEIIHKANGPITLTVNAGEEKHLVLLSPGQVTLQVEQRRNSLFTLHVIQLSDADSNVSVTVRQKEEGCLTRLYGMALTLGEQRADLETHVMHEVGHGKSEQLIKNVLADRSRVSFYGELRIAPDAQQTQATQTNRNILLSPEAKVRTRPQLEIYADDVKASHGATTGQLDANALFYMQQRGIPQDQAKRLLLEAFLEEVIQTLPDDQHHDQHHALPTASLQDTVRLQLNKRLA